MESLVGQEGQLLEFSVNASDFNDDAISLALVRVPLAPPVLLRMKAGLAHTLAEPVAHG